MLTGYSRTKIGQGVRGFVLFDLDLASYDLDFNPRGRAMVMTHTQ